MNKTSGFSRSGFASPFSPRMVRLWPTAATACALLLPLVAYGHSGHGSESHAASGFLHPFTGWDHLLGLLAIGLWAGLAGRREALKISVAAMGMLGVGLMVGVLGVGSGLAEAGVVASLLLFGLLVALAIRLPLGVAAGVAGSFVLFHGWAHGLEAAGGASAFYLAGFMMGSAVVFLAGVFASILAERVRSIPWVRTAGASIFACGAIFIAATWILP
jgi:urease accessory protein